MKKMSRYRLPYKYRFNLENKNDIKFQFYRELLDLVIRGEVSLEYGGSAKSLFLLNLLLFLPDEFCDLDPSAARIRLKGIPKESENCFLYINLQLLPFFYLSILVSFEKNITYVRKTTNLN